MRTLPLVQTGLLPEPSSTISRCRRRPQPDRKRALQIEEWVTRLGIRFALRCIQRLSDTA